MKTILVLICSVQIYQTQAQAPLPTWREDGRCGENYPLPTGRPGQCDPQGNGPKKGPCCSSKGFCGNTRKHCECDTCVDYSANIPKSDKSTIFEKENKSEKGSEPSSKTDTSPSSTKVVKTRVGDIKGMKLTSEDGETLYQFLGVPYAQPPVGNLRFKAPLPVRPWTNTLDAFNIGPYCHQKGYLQSLNNTMSEDCLYLNIYTPDLNLTSKPVMLWIHGGGFTQGSGNEYKPGNLIKEDVILVTINYRLGGLGFLTFGNNVVSGNMGLKDQALAIQWVKQNIEMFGGNPDKITIFGESAGGISVHAQVLSPWNFGQLRAAIAQSGSMLIYNKIKTAGEREEVFAQKAAEVLGCSNKKKDLNQKTLECLQKVNVEKINDEFSNEYAWHPVVDNYALNPFLPLNPLEAMKTKTFNRIPFMSGTVKSEGALFLSVFEELKDNWEILGPKFMFRTDFSGDTTREDVMIANISFKYYNHPKDDTKIAQDQPLVDLLSDVSFISPDQKTVQLMSQASPHVFNYHLIQPTEHSLPDAEYLNETCPLDYSPCHADDQLFMFEFGEKLKRSKEESSLSDYMVKYWTNFAKYGHPTPSDQDLPFWSSVTETEKNYMELSSMPKMKKDLLGERMMFWEKMLWEAKEDDIEREIFYKKAVEFLN